MGVVAFDEVGVVAVHGADQIGKRGQQGRGQAAAEARGLLGEVEREVGKRPPIARAVRDQQRLHQGNKLAPVFRFNVRIHGRPF